MIASQAEDALTRSLSAWHNDVPAWMALCKMRQLRGDLDGALEAATAATNLAPQSEEALADLATAAAATGRFDSAINAGGELIRMNPSSLDPLLLCAPESTCKCNSGRRRKRTAERRWPFIPCTRGRGCSWPSACITWAIEPGAT